MRGLVISPHIIGRISAWSKTHIYTQLKIGSLLWFSHNHISACILTLTLFYFYQTGAVGLFSLISRSLYLAHVHTPCSRQQYSWSCWLCWEEMWSSSYKMNERVSLETLLLASSQPKQMFLPLLHHFSSCFLHFCFLCAFLYHLGKLSAFQQSDNLSTKCV